MSEIDTVGSFALSKAVLHAGGQERLYVLSRYARTAERKKDETVINR